MHGIRVGTALALLLLSLGTGACSASRDLPPLGIPVPPVLSEEPHSSGPPSEEVPSAETHSGEIEPSGLAVGEQAWELPPERVPSQSLYRLRIEGDESRGRLRLTLRLAAPDHFQLAAADPLGRTLWVLHVEGDEALLLDHRQETACRYGREVDLETLRLGSFSLGRLPALILGRLPAEPSAGVLGRPRALGGGSYELWDSRGRRWTYTETSFQAGTREPGLAASPGGPLQEWSLWDPARPDPRLHFQRARAGGEEWKTLTDLSDDGAVLRLRWRQGPSEALAAGVRLPAPETPPGYSAADCP